MSENQDYIIILDSDQIIIQGLIDIDKIYDDKDV